MRPLLISSGKQVGSVGMAIDGDLDRATGCVKLRPGKPVTVAFLLSDESIASLRIVIQDPTTDAELYRSPIDIPYVLEFEHEQCNIPAPDTLDDKANRLFAGKVVRKDLVRKVKVGANVPVFVLEFLRGKYYASSENDIFGHFRSISEI